MNKLDVCKSRTLSLMNFIKPEICLFSLVIDEEEEDLKWIQPC